MEINLIKTQQYLDWLKDKLYLNHIAPNAQKRIVLRGEVYRCKFGVGIGSEECKERPCVILQHDSANKTSPNTLVAPISHTNSIIPVVVPISPKKDSAGKIILDGNVLLGNITCISKARLGTYLTKLTKDEMNRIDKAISVSLDLFHHYNTLNNLYQDKLRHIDTLHKQYDNLKTEHAYLNQQLKKLYLLLDTYQLADIDALAALLETLQNSSRQNQQNVLN